MWAHTGYPLVIRKCLTSPLVVLLMVKCTWRLLRGPHACMSDSLLGPALSYSCISVNGTLQPALLILTQTCKEAKNLNPNLDTPTALNSPGIKTISTINKDKPQTENTTKCFPDEGLMCKTYKELLKLNKPSSFASCF